MTALGTPGTNLLKISLSTAWEGPSLEGQHVREGGREEWWERERVAERGISVRISVLFTLMPATSNPCFLTLTLISCW